MLFSGNKRFRIENKAIKIGIVLLLGLIVGPFLVTGNVLATAEFFEDNFNSYDYGDLAGQGYWKSMEACYSFEISTTTAKSGKVATYDLSSYGNCNLKDGVGIASSTDGVFSFEFYMTQEYQNQKLFFTLTDSNAVNSPDRYNNALLRIGINTTGVIDLNGVNTTSTIVANTTPLNVLNTIEIEYNLITHFARAKLEGSFWSDYIPLRSDVDYINSYYIEGGDTNQEFFIDTIWWASGYAWTPPCDFGGGCQFCNTSTTCAYHNCIWSENFCWNTLPPELPELEDCSELGITDKLLCEIKNFFYRIFIPSQEKVTELTTTIDLVKTKFPYSYLLEVKDFFAYLKDNINEDQDINFSVLGQAGVVNMEVWNTTTTIAGSESTFISIFKKFFSFIIIAGFIFWCFSFLRKIFK